MLSTKNFYFYLYGLVLVALFALIFFLLALDSAQMTHLVQEGGPIESLTVAMYFICLSIIVIANLTNKSKFTNNWSLMLILLAFALRELDFHTRFTTISVTKIKFYIHPNVPVIEKLIAVTLILLIASSLWNSASRHFLPYISSLKQREPHALGVFWGTILLVFSKTLDGAQRKLNDFRVVLSREALDFAGVIEESSELFIPIMFLIAIAAFYTGKTRQ